MEEEVYEEKIPRNRSGGQRIGELFRKRNIIEAVIFCLLVCFPIFLIPFTVHARTVLCMIFGMSTLAINLIGIKNRSITENLILTIKEKSRRRVLKLGSVADVKKKGITENQNIRSTAAGQFLYDFVEGWEEGEYSSDIDKKQSFAKRTGKKIRSSIEIARSNIGI